MWNTHHSSGCVTDPRGETKPATLRPRRIASLMRLGQGKRFLLRARAIFENPPPSPSNRHNHHLALLLSKASGWRNHAFFHVHGAKKEDNCAPRGKHASAPHRPALPLPAIRLASASHMEQRSAAVQRRNEHRGRGGGGGAAAAAAAEDSSNGGRGGGGGSSSNSSNGGRRGKDKAASAAGVPPPAAAAVSAILALSPGTRAAVRAALAAADDE